VIKTGYCEICTKEDTVGFMACTAKTICPKCASLVLSVPEEDIRKMIGKTDDDKEKINV